MVRFRYPGDLEGLGHRDGRVEAPRVRHDVYELLQDEGRQREAAAVVGKTASQVLADLFAFGKDRQVRVDQDVGVESVSHASTLMVH